MPNAWIEYRPENGLLSPWIVMRKIGDALLLYACRTSDEATTMLVLHSEQFVDGLTGGVGFFSVQIDSEGK